MTDTTPGTRRSAAFVVAAAVVVFGLILAACGSSGAKVGSGSSRTTTARVAAVTVHDADNGHAVTVPVGAAVHLVLDTTYWQVTGADRAGVLRAAGAATYLRGQCPPGIGCGTTNAEFTAVAPGSVHLRASRMTCGEALKCQAPRRDYVVTVVVTG